MGVIVLMTALTTMEVIYIILLLKEPKFKNHSSDDNATRHR